MIKMTIDKDLEFSWKHKLYNAIPVRIDGDEYIVVNIEPTNGDEYAVDLVKTCGPAILDKDQIIADLDRSYLNRRGKRMQDTVAARLGDEKRNAEILRLNRSRRARNYQLEKALMSTYYAQFDNCMGFDKALASLKRGAKIWRSCWDSRYWKEYNGGIKEYYEQYIGDELHVSERSIVPDDDDLMATDWMTREE